MLNALLCFDINVYLVASKLDGQIMMTPTLVYRYRSWYTGSSD